MFSTPNRRPLHRGLVAALAASAALIFGGCSTAGPETGADVEDIQEETGGGNAAGGGGLNVFNDAQSFAGQQVTVSAEVSEIVSPNAFRVGAENAEALLVVHNGSTALNQNSPVKVTGTVKRSFALSEAESFAGADFDDSLFTEFEGEPYIQAQQIDTTVTPDTN